jgi:hypothetical protein
MTVSQAVPDIANSLAALMLEILYFSFMFFGGLTGIKRTQISPLSGFSIYLSRVEPIFPAF